MITVNIICSNEEKNIEACLKSASWADEIVVVDGESKDRTAEIAKRFTDKVLVNKWQGYAKQRQFALDNSTGDWVLVLDADERCSDGLKEEALAIANDASCPYSGFRVPRKNFFLGKWIKHGGWYPGYQYRFFMRERFSLTENVS